MTHFQAYKHARSQLLSPFDIINVLFQVHYNHLDGICMVRSDKNIIKRAEFVRVRRVNDHLIRKSAVAAGGWLLAQIGGG